MCWPLGALGGDGVFWPLRVSRADGGLALGGFRANVVSSLGMVCRVCLAGFLLGFAGVCLSGFCGGLPCWVWRLSRLQSQVRDQQDVDCGRVVRGWGGRVQVVVEGAMDLPEQSKEGEWMVPGRHAFEPKWLCMISAKGAQPP